MKSALAKGNTVGVRRMAEEFRNIAKAKSAKGTSNSGLLYYETLAQYCEKIASRVDEGGSLAAAESFAPTEILYAMDIIPINVVLVSWSMGLLLKQTPDFLAQSEAFGLPWEACSGHRVIIGALLREALPPFDLAVGCSMGCNNLAKSVREVMRLYQRPGFQLDFPAGASDEEVQYLASEMADLVTFLEEQTGRKMDWDRLKEVVALSVKESELWREIGQLRKTTPAPMKSRTYIQHYWIDMCMAGTPEATNYYQVVRDEVKANVEKGRGAVAQEKFRFISLLLPPQHKLKLIDWMEYEKGAVSVMEIHCSHWGDFEPDPSQPLVTLARRYLQRPPIRQLRGPATRELLDDVVKDAIDYKADAALMWSLVTCHTTPSTAKAVKDRLMEKAGIPLLVIDTDSTDPHYRSDEELRNDVTSFLEVIGGNRG